MKYWTLAARLLIGGLFVYASVHKLFDPADFAAAIRNYQLLPAALSNLAAMSLPWVEITAGVFLMLGILTRPSALITTVMMSVFLAAIIFAFATGLDIDCGCFTSAASSSGRIGVYHIVRDSFLLLICLSILLLDKGYFSVAGLLRPAQIPADEHSS